MPAEGVREWSLPTRVNHVDHEGAEQFTREGAAVHTEQKMSRCHCISCAPATFSADGNLHLSIARASYLLIDLSRLFIGFLLICKSSFLRKRALYHIAINFFHFVIHPLILSKDFVCSFCKEI